MPNENPREWNIQVDPHGMVLGSRNVLMNAESVPVIEKSAYDELEAEIERLKLEKTYLIQAKDNAIDHANEWQTKLTLVAELVDDFMMETGLIEDQSGHLEAVRDRAVDFLRYFAASRSQGEI